MNTEEKLRLIKEVGEEIIGEDQLIKMLNDENYTPVAYDGFEPSGNIHIAQGLLRSINVNKLTKTGIKFKFWIADWFAMLNNKLGGDLNKIRITGEYFIEVWRACGMDLDNVEFIWASEYIKEHPKYWETVLKLSTNATVTRVLRCGQIMGREENVSNPASQIMYPLMQAADIHHLGADIAQLGMDQRKVNMLARDVFPKLKFKKPIAIHHHMLMGLTEPPKSDAKGIEAAIAKKMSKSNPNSAIFMTDSSKEITRKFNKAFCPDKSSENNPVLEYLKYIVFERFEKVVIERYKKEPLEFSNYRELETSYVEGNIHPADLKQSTAKYIDELIEPIRRHFETNKTAKKLLEEINNFKVTK